MFKRSIATSTDQGFAVIGMVIVMMLLSTALLISFQSMLTRSQQERAQTYRDFQAINDAYSALALAQQMTWNHPSSQWQCQSHTNAGRSCLKASHYAAIPYLGITDDDDSLSTITWAILKGESTQSETSIRRYQLVAIDALGGLHYLPRHQLDICPDYKGGPCD